MDNKQTAETLATSILGFCDKATLSENDTFSLNLATLAIKLELDNVSRVPCEIVEAGENLREHMEDMYEALPKDYKNSDAAFRALQRWLHAVYDENGTLRAKQEA